MVTAIRPPGEPPSADRHIAAATSATHRLLVTIGFVSVLTLVLAVEAMSHHRDSRFVLAGATATVMTPVLWACSYQTFTARRRAIAAHADTQQRLSAFVGTANEVLWETTSDGIITYVGPRAESLLGYAPEEIVGQGIDVVLAGRDHQRALELLATSMAGRHGWTRERFVLLTRDGREKEMYSSALIHTGKGGEPIGFTGTLSEVEPETQLAEEFARLHHSVRAVIDDRSLQSVYQPIVSLSGGALIGAEALTRFTATPQMSPDKWFGLAAEVGLGVDLELLALRQALSNADRLPQHIYLSVNLSPQALADDRTFTLLEDSAWPTTQLVVEITEHVSVPDYDDLALQVHRLRELGARIAVDDAGAGYSSFRHILRLRPDFIKLDRALVDGLDHDPAKRALAGAFVAFGQEVEASIIAEGVETAHELDTARALGMHAAQGFHTGRPAPPGERWGVDAG